jgi:hypothetical protein
LPRWCLHMEDCGTRCEPRVDYSERAHFLAEIIKIDKHLPTSRLRGSFQVGRSPPV